ncbi:hypothetical protein RB195_009188 [Necator americanus]|uniref:Uncharacterized protein n=2 Tax=Necator americanus TaxID=51031 RepID=A0ABR1CUQ8_NECAM|nr:hypothetical protein NECAME_11034 [Necator americanus]ETN77437.1 hypothetical protein NECAME_11034 [Necator americanus]
MIPQNSTERGVINVALRVSKENIEIVPQETCVQHKGPETMIQERQSRSMHFDTVPEERHTNDVHRKLPQREQKRLSVI